jgi:hypothetical protein
MAPCRPAAGPARRHGPSAALVRPSPARTLGAWLGAVAWRSADWPNPPPPREFVPCPVVTTQGGREPISEKAPIFFCAWYAISEKAPISFLFPIGQTPHPHATSPSQLPVVG